MYKTVTKYALIVCAVLMIGQIDINQRQLGGYFTAGVRALCTWFANRLVENPFVAKLAKPSGLELWFPFGEMSRKKNPAPEKRADFGTVVPVEQIENAKGDETVEEFDEFSENELESEQGAIPKSESDDDAVMAILP